ncbi:putative multidrug resistance protein [Platanthera guangdongensis]|uniref:Multidrug resistance protein n=1 Tax=Platanthera guangdongensis TaxID=2320717 RepID=A0ABR2M6X6_9ASPA
MVNHPDPMCLFLEDAPSLLRLVVRQHWSGRAELNANAISDVEVEAAARAANAHEFICGLPKGYEASCGEHGEMLSGGQKQRICGRSILLLDEASSAIDGQSEMIVKEALERLMVGRTTVVVAHKLSTVKNCHAIVVLEKGVVIEKGDHASLMKRRVTGKYYNLERLQRNVQSIGTTKIQP